MRHTQQMTDLQQLQSTQRRTVSSTSERSSSKQAKVKKYGNMLVIYDGMFLITLGPDYWCFIPTFIVFVALSAVMIWFVLTYSHQFYLQITTVIICVGMCLAYLAVATSDPGIVTQQDLTDSQQYKLESQQIEPGQATKHRKKLCRRCNIRVDKQTFHCSDCDVCVRNYDHHCPWTSKCIGGGNMKRFYFFVTMVPVFLIFTFVAFAIIMSQIALEQAAKRIKTLPSPNILSL